MKCKICNLESHEIFPKYYFCLNFIRSKGYHFVCFRQLDKFKQFMILRRIYDNENSNRR
jgi:hypothetical protein